MAKAPTVGELRNYITIQQPVISVDEYGQTNRTWINVDIKLPARISVKSHNHMTHGDQAVAVTETTFTVRYRTVYFDSYRILYAGKYYSILSINDMDGTRKWLDIKAVESSDNGESTV